MVETQNRLPPDGPIEQRFRAVCVDFVESLAMYPAIVQLMNVEGTRATDCMDYIFQIFLRELSWPIGTLLEEGKAQGVFRDVHVTISSTMLTHGARALVALRPLVGAVDASLEGSPDAITRTIQDAVDIVVRGLKI